MKMHAAAGLMAIVWGGIAPLAVRAAEDSLVLSSGSVLALQGDDISRLSDEIRLRDGTKVRPDGTLTRPNGTSGHLAEGQRIDLAGKLGPIPPGEATESGRADDSASVKPQ